MDRDDFQRLANIRLEEAYAFLEAGHFDGAYYLAGYAIECALKACIAGMTRANEFPDLGRAREIHTHNLLNLVRAAGLDDSRRSGGGSDLSLSDVSVTGLNDEVVKLLRKGVHKEKDLSAVRRTGIVIDNTYIEDVLIYRL